ncbi:hypothetical protein BOX15_Mlig021826g5 [Macrostomum lignano]|uniref:C2H2-type domain-containing protein n=1 Tax=Macrostomum lignano TaxID=282301 RepID=A0A267FXR2_9PLAT|nr:hypothetical protein BOX15_Mlig021826g3 [Macrostomum lignano]PAA78536.1 hypothetical protein BOX15_Mlig021826g5 [Macrostomum lignano]
MTELIMEPTEKLQEQLHQQVTILSPKPRKKSHFCNKCGKSFVSSRNLERHQLSVKGRCRYSAAIASVMDASSSSSSSAFNIESLPADMLASASPFFINCFGRYQFNTNSAKQSVNCPFCLVHKTSIQGLSKHCFVNHKSQYMDWKSGAYGKVQLRWIPPDEHLVNKVLQALKDAGLLDKDIPLADIYTFVPREQIQSSSSARSRPKKFYKQSKKVLFKDLPAKSANWRKIRAAAAMETASAWSPPTAPNVQVLPPPPPLVDCRNLTAAVADNPAATAAVESSSLSSVEAMVNSIAAPSNEDFHHLRHQIGHDSNYYYNPPQHLDAYHAPSHCSRPVMPEEFLSQVQHHPSYYTGDIGDQWQPAPLQVQQPQSPSSFNYNYANQHQSVPYGGMRSAFVPPQPPPQQTPLYDYEYCQGSRAFGFCPPQKPPQLKFPSGANLPPYPLQLGKRY